MKHALDLLCCMGVRRGHLLQDWRLHCLVVIGEWSGMAGVTWRDRVRSAEVARRCGVRELGDVLRVLKVGLVRACGEKRGDGDLWDLKRPGEEVCKKNLQEEQEQNRDQWKRVINHLTS